MTGIYTGFFILIPAVAVIVALLIDRFYGEPPVRLHPVVAMGAWLRLCAGWVKAPLSSGSAYRRGLLAWLVGASLCALLAGVLQWLLFQVPYWLAAILLGILLKPLLAWRMLRDEVIAVEQALTQSLDAGRERLSWLVSRDTSQLTEIEVRESAIETLAENLNDSVIAPLFWFCLGGLPAAAVYRFANTADAMWGYRGEWEWAGKWAAQIDDVLSWLPARLTALLLIPPGVRRLRRIASITPSPNGGWPMGAMALCLDARLTKPGAYTLHASGHAPTAEDTTRAVQFAGRAVWLAALLSVLTTTALGVLLWF